jgi:inhibitor of KinA sporulation pathway (predicted exonuclease)
MSTKRDHMLVIDLEATCWRGHPPKGMFSEIIEIGIAVVDNKTKDIIAKESLIIKPEYSEISKFCTELTTLTQEFVDSHGISFARACEILTDKYKSKKRIYASWGNYDKKQMIKDCNKKKVDFPFSDFHYNLEPLFSFALGIDKELSVGKALEYLNVEFSGVQHRGVDDAFNTALIVKSMFKGSTL